MARDPGCVPITFIDRPELLGRFAAAVRTAVDLAIDTETPIAGPRRGRMRVMSAATRDAHGAEQAFVIDARDLDPTLLAPILDGQTAIAWNANFDARVVDDAVWESADTTQGLTWYDAQIADALLHQGRSGFTWFHGLAWATEQYLGIVAQGKGTVQLSYTADDDLNPDQVRYAAADAVETLWVADAIRAELTAGGLETVAEIEMAARPLIDQMERTGLPFDWSGWQRELDLIADRHRQVLDQLSSLTGGGQGTLFDQVVEPTWNPASDKQVRHALNRWAAPEVEAYTAARFGRPRPLSEHDSVSAGVLGEIGGPLCTTLLEFRDGAKVLSTYGESIREHLHDDGRMRPQYLQVVGTNTGRLASRSPNAQNFTPRMKPFVRPADPDRVFVHADLSQAELRYLAQVACDEALRAAFARGEDVHVSTAATMFGFDARDLAATDPDEFKAKRQVAKALNFGIAYGTGAASLARSLSANGTSTSLDEGKRLLSQYRATYPGTAAWAAERIAEIERVAASTRDIDWALTLRLARMHPKVTAARRAFRQQHRRWPSVQETVDEMVGPTTSAPTDLTADVEFSMGYSAPVALLADASALTFASRTAAGRRQQFNVHIDRVLLLASIEAMGSTRPDVAKAAIAFELAQGWDPDRSGRLDVADLTRRFEDRALRLRFVESLVEGVGLAAIEDLLARAARERVRAMVNAWRNAPIQGGVADIMLDACGRIFRALAEFPTARAVQTVHDSIVIECDRVDAEQVAILVRTCLHEASVRFCPDVRPQADVDIRFSLADTDIDHELE